jgi:hypothetical protein
MGLRWGGASDWRSFRIRPRRFRHCPVSTIIGGGCPEIRTECQRQHGKTASKREEKRQYCDEGLHGRSPSGDENGSEATVTVSALARIQCEDIHTLRYFRGHFDPSWRVRSTPITGSLFDAALADSAEKGTGNRGLLIGLVDPPFDPSVGWRPNALGCSTNWRPQRR